MFSLTSCFGKGEDESMGDFTAEHASSPWASCVHHLQCTLPGFHCPGAFFLETLGTALRHCILRLEKTRNMDDRGTLSREGLSLHDHGFDALVCEKDFSPAFLELNQKCLLLSIPLGMLLQFNCRENYL